MSQYMNSIGKNARKATLEKVSTSVKNKVLKRYALLLDEERNLIIKENIKDIKFAQKKRLKNNLIDRLTIDSKKLENIRNSIKKITNVQGV